MRRPRPRGGRRHRARPPTGSGDDDSQHWNDGSSLRAASEDFSEPGSATAEQADEYVSSSGAAFARRPIGSDSGSARSLPQRQAGQLDVSASARGTTGATNIGASAMGRRQPPHAADTEDVLSQLLGDLGVNERDQLNEQPRGIRTQPAHSLQQLGGPSHAAKCADGTHSRPQPPAASVPRPPTGWPAMPRAAMAPPPVAPSRPPQASPVFGAGFPPAVTQTAQRPAPPPEPSRLVFGSTVPQWLTQHQPERAGSPAAQQSELTLSRATQVPAGRAEVSSALHIGKAPSRGAGRRRAALPQEDTLLRCPITQVQQFAMLTSCY